MEKPTDEEIIEAINAIKQPASFDAIIKQLGTDCEQSFVSARLTELSNEGKIKAVPAKSPGLHFTLP